MCSLWLHDWGMIWGQVAAFRSIVGRKGARSELLHNRKTSKLDGVQVMLKRAVLRGIHGIFAYVELRAALKSLPNDHRRDMYT